MRRNWFLAAVLVGVAAIVIAAVAMRLTADDKSSATGWAESVCTSLGDWRASVVALTDVSGGLTADSLQERLDEAEDATEDLVTELRDLGPPDLDAGEELEQRLDTSVDGLETEYEALRSDVEQALDAAASPADLFQGLAALAPQFQSLLGAASNVVEELRSAASASGARSELEQAFAEAEPCRELREAS